MTSLLSFGGRRAVLIIGLLTLSPGVLALADAAAPAAKQRPLHPALRPIEDTPGLPRVLLIGDSISIAYTLPVRRELQGVANVHRPPTNCETTVKGLRDIEAWLGDKPWDVIHFNWGLHDLKYMGPQGQNLADPMAEDSHQNVPMDQYEANLNKLVARLKKTGARLIWRTTTPVIDGARGRVAADVARYNAVAARVMAEHGIPVDDAHAAVVDRATELLRPDKVHFAKEGTQLLAKRAAVAIEAALATPVP